MADQRIDQLNTQSTLLGGDLLPLFSSNDTKKISAKELVQQGVALIDNAIIPVAKVNLSGISGANLSAGTVPISALDAANDILAAGGLAVASGNLELIAPTSPIVRNAGTGSLEHAVSGATAGTYTKVTVDTRGHVTVGANLVGADVPIATSSVVGGVSIPAAGGFALTGGGALSHSNTVAGGASVLSGITYDLQGHIVSTAALVAADLPVATNAVKGAVIAGGGLAIDVNGILSTAVATTSDLGGIKIGSEFGLNGSNQLLLAVQANVAGGTQYPKVTVNSKGVITAGAALAATDIPNLDASKITTGSVDIARIAANTITGGKLANYSVCKIGDTTPTADYTSQFFFNPLSRDLFLFDGNVFQPIGISVGEIIFAGTFNASTGSGTGLIASVTAEGTAIGLTVGQALPAPAAGNSRYYLVVSNAGTITSGNAPQVALSPPDIVLSNGTSWTEIDVSQTITAQVASNVSFTPAGNISSGNVQLAIQELDTEKLPIAGGTITGNLEIGTAGSFSFEGSTANNFETFLSATDPTVDRAIVFPDQNGNVIVSGNASIVNADINASAAIVDTKFATIATAGKVSNSATTATDANTASAIVARDASGNFIAGTITAALTGNASTATTLATARNIQGVSFNGSAAITVVTAGTGISVTGTAVANTGVLSVNSSTGAITNVAVTNAAQSYSAAQRGAISALTDGATITADFAVANNFSVTLGGNRTLANPSNLTAGQSGCIWITQDGTGSRTLAYGSQWDFTGGTAPTLSTAAAAVDCVVYAVQSSTKITATLITDLS